MAATQTKKTNLLAFSLRSLLLVTLLVSIFFVGRESIKSSLRATMERLAAENRLLERKLKMQQADIRQTQLQAEVEVLEAETKLWNFKVELQNKRVEELRARIPSQTK